MENLMLVRDSEMADEASLSTLDGAVVDVQLALRRAEAAKDALAARQKATDVAGEHIAVAMKEFIRQLCGSSDGVSWRSIYIGTAPRSIADAVCYLDAARDMMIRAAAADEAKAAALPDAAALRRMNAAAKSLGYHAARAKEGR